MEPLPTCPCLPLCPPTPVSLPSTTSKLSKPHLSSSSSETPHPQLPSTSEEIAKVVCVHLLCLNPVMHSFVRNFIPKEDPRERPISRGASQEKGPCLLGADSCTLQMDKSR